MRTAEHWKKIGFKPHHGICLPLFALRSHASCGIGEFLDLLPLIRWCRESGFDVLQLLPLNDTGSDPSPFYVLSSYALDPIYLSLSALPGAQGDFTSFRPLNALPRLARNEVKQLKTQWLFRYFEKIFPSVSNTPAYQAFLSQNPWLLDYAKFKALKEEYNEQPWKDWPVSYHAASPNPRRIDYHCFLQHLCFSQMEQVKAFASEHTVFLKGDLPILPSPDSADVWANPSLFRLDLCAGAPPDAYNPLGQKWGFPICDWEKMRQQKFAWWKERLRIIGRLYHIYRIDHVVGLFRIWAMAPEKQAASGYFVPPDPSTWLSQGKEILEMIIDSSSLLPIAEDLGTIPEGVYPVLKKLGICGTKVLRWQRFDAGRGGFIPYEEYEPFSMTTVSNADLDPLPLWWKKYPEDAAAFAAFKHWTFEPVLAAEKQLAILHDAHHTPSYFHINPLQEYLFAFSELVWPNLEEERINIPGTLLPINWTYRFRSFLEEITSHRKLAESIRAILKPNRLKS